MITYKPKLNNNLEEVLHRMHAVDRKRQILLTIDDQSYWEGEETSEQLPIEDYRGTHPKRSFWDILSTSLKQLLP